MRRKLPEFPLKSSNPNLKGGNKFFGGLAAAISGAQFGRLAGALDGALFGGLTATC